MISVGNIREEGNDYNLMLKHENKQIKRLEYAKITKRIHHTTLILNKKEKISTFFQENMIYTPKEGVSIF